MPVTPSLSLSVRCFGRRHQRQDILVTCSHQSTHQRHACRIYNLSLENYYFFDPVACILSWSAADINRLSVVRSAPPSIAPGYTISPARTRSHQLTHKRQDIHVCCTRSRHQRQDMLVTHGHGADTFLEGEGKRGKNS